MATITIIETSTHRYARIGKSDVAYQVKRADGCWGPVRSAPGADRRHSIEERKAALVALKG